MKLLRTIRDSLYPAALFALIAGHFDLAVRVRSGNFEWFEIYLALLLPLLACSFAALLLLLVTKAVLAAAQRKGPGPAWIAWSFWVALSLLILLLYLINFAFFGDQSFWQGQRLEGTLLCVLLALAIFVLLARSEGRFAPRIEWLINSSSAGRLCRGYLQFTVFFVISCLAVDCYELRRHPRHPDRQPGNTKPNIILITLDTVRPDHLSLYGYHKDTSPNLLKLADKSLLFTNAISTSSWTLPAHASLFTGKFIFEHGSDEFHQQLDESERTLAEIASAAGLATAGFAGGPYCKAKFGVAQGFDYFSDRLDFFEYRFTKDSYSTRRLLEFVSPSIMRRLFQADGEKTAPELNAEIFRWLSRNQASNFLLFINYFDAHDPYTLGQEYRSLFTSERRDDAALQELLTDYYYDGSKGYAQKTLDSELLEYAKALYDSELRFLDHHLGQLFAELKRLNLWDNTVLIITADHGEEFMEHGGVLHKQTLYEESIRIPLLIHYPAVIAAGRVPERVSITDIPATILALLGVNESFGAGSYDLVALSRAGGRSRPAIISELYAREMHGASDLAAISAGDWKLIEVTRPQPRIPSGLFDLRRDPGEKENLIETAPQNRAQLAAELQKVRGLRKVRRFPAD